jgi:TPR repeat protein
VKILKAILSVVALLLVIWQITVRFTGDDGARADKLLAQKKYPEAMVIYKELAQKGNAAAAYDVGVMYAKGEGVPVDQAEAVTWYRMGADNGDADAMFNLGVYYDNGNGVAQSDQEAFNWYTKAANRKDQSAMLNLGVMYSTGQGIKSDPVEAEKWYILAGDRGKKNKGVLDAILTPEQRAEAEKRAREWKPQT